MRRLTATEAARRLSDVLDRVEHEGETFVVERHGRPIASIAPAPAATGRSVKELLRSTSADSLWARELAELRASVATEERSWND